MNLHLLWLASPTLPVGGYSYSEGLEAATQAGVHNEASAQAWLLSQLHLSWARAEAPLLAAAFKACHAHDAAALQALNDWHLQTRESAELKRQTEQMGHSMAVWLRQAQADGSWPSPALPAWPTAPTWPLMFALAAACVEQELGPVLQTFGFAWAQAQTQAAIKLTPLGQTAGQRLLAALVAALPQACSAALAGAPPLCFTPMLALLSAQHETQFTRFYRS